MFWKTRVYLLSNIVNLLGNLEMALRPYLYRNALILPLYLIIWRWLVQNLHVSNIL
jgi:hypothetical protein